MSRPGSVGVTSGDRAWRRRAACQGLPPAVFFPPDRGEQPPAPWTPDPALAVCAACPVVEDCRAWALATRQKHGVWGGMTEEELRRRRAQTRRRAS